MEKKKRNSNLSLIAVVLFWMGCSSARAWVNGNFETCDLTGWTTSTGSGPNLACGPPTATVVSGGFAPLSNNMLPRVHGGNCAAQLYSARGDNNHQDWARIEQTDTVPTNGNTCLSFWFAAVFEDHHFELGESEDTYIEADVIVGGAPVATLIYSWANSLPLVVFDGLTGTGGAACAVNPTTQNRWGYLPWTNYVINLCKYAGQQVTLRVTDYDCGQGGHYGYGYLDDVTWESCPPPSVKLTKTNSPNGQVSRGATITYTLNYQNTGAGVATNVVVTDPIPANSILVPNSISSSPSVPASQVGNTIGWYMGLLPGGSSGTLSFQVTADQSCVTFVNQAMEMDDLKSCSTPGALSNPVTNWVGGCTPTPTFSLTATSTYTVTATATRTSTYTVTDTSTPIPTSTPTPTRTYTVIATSTYTTTFTRTPTFGITPTSTYLSPSPSPTSDVTPMLTVTATSQNNPSSTPTSDMTPNLTPTSTFQDNPTSTPTSDMTPNLTVTSTFQNNPSSTPTSDMTPNLTPTSTFQDNPTSTPTSDMTPNLTVTSTSQNNPTSTPTPDMTPMITPTSTSQNNPTATPTPDATAVVTPTGTSVGNNSPTPTPDRTVVITPTGTSVDNNTPTPTSAVTAVITPIATSAGNNTPTLTPTLTARPTFTASPTWTQTATSIPSFTATPSFTPDAKATGTSTSTVTFSPTPTAPGFTASVDTFYVSKNLFTPSTGPVSIYIAYGIYPGPFELVVYNSAGEVIKTLASQQLAGPVNQSYSWDGTNKYGATVASGVYLLSLREPFSKKIKKVLFVR